MPFRGYRNARVIDKLMALGHVSNHELPSRRTLGRYSIAADGRGPGPRHGLGEGEIVVANHPSLAAEVTDVGAARHPANA